VTSKPSTPTNWYLRLLLVLATVGVCVCVAIGALWLMQRISDARAPRGKRTSEDAAWGYLLSVHAGLRLYETQGRSCNSLDQLIEAGYVSTFTIGYDVRIVSSSEVRAIALPVTGNGRPLALAGDGSVRVLDRTAASRVTEQR
jgi:hypothetical protein